ncbi:MAG: LysM peptidoglycan-binding domain-containing protein [Gammaproteobacteria bacterium]|nr:LysM peptidoglycan-binding domain-containing protein [Gammaproteobacteria bacterium]
MMMRTTARLFAAVALSLGLLAGCATTGDDAASAAEQAIADAKAANAEVAAMGYEWRDTGKIIEQAEAALADGDNEKALELANTALAQAEDAMRQAELEKQKFLDRTAGDMDDSMAAGAGAGADSYTVVRGDNLWNISGKSDIYGDPYQWPLIYKANRSQIKDPDLIFPGQNFSIDRSASSSEIDAAINHARTRGAWSVGDVEQSDLDFLAR